MKLDPAVLRLIDELSAQEANAYVGDPNDTYDKIIKLCNYNMDVVTAHFEAKANIDEPRF